MAKVSIVIGALLIALGIYGYWPKHAPTALIPSLVGVLILIAGFIALNPAMRKHAMHAAVIVSLLGFITAAGRIGMVVAKGTFGEDRLATIAVSGMALLTALHVVLCIRSFIAARKARQAGAGAAA